MIATALVIDRRGRPPVFPMENTPHLLPTAPSGGQLGTEMLEDVFNREDRRPVHGPASLEAGQQNASGPKEQPESQNANAS